jgi:hypothetical protein
MVYNDKDEIWMNDDSVKHQITDPVPALNLIKRWGPWFPAMGIDFGIPDTGGWNSGVRHMEWASANGTGIAGTAHLSIGGTQNVWRRDYTNAIVLHRPAQYNTTAGEYTTPSAPMALGGTYYPLYADGTTGAAITSISLRTGEGAILMKSPIGGEVPPGGSEVFAIVSPGRYETTQDVMLNSAGATTIKYCFGQGCTPENVFTEPFKVLRNQAATYLRMQADSGTVTEAIYRKQRRR